MSPLVQVVYFRLGASARSAWATEGDTSGKVGIGGQEKNKFIFEELLCLASVGSGWVEVGQSKMAM